MKLLVSSDLHGNHDAYRWLAETARGLSVPIVLCGDLLGCPAGYTTVEEAQRADADTVGSLLSEGGVPVYYVLGNDDHIEALPRSPLFHPLHERRLELDRWNLVGYQHSLPFAGGPHERPEDVIGKDLARIEPMLDSSTIFVTHSPAHGILDRGALNRQIGSRSIRDLLRRKDVWAHVHGHAHEARGRFGRRFNVAAAGESRAVLLDLVSLKGEVLWGF